MNLKDKIKKNIKGTHYWLLQSRLNYIITSIVPMQYEVLHIYLLFKKNQGGEMLYAQRVGLAEVVAYSLKPPLSSSNKVTSKKSKKLWTKGPEWNNAAYEEKEKYHHFTHPARDYTNSHPHFKKRERMRTWETEKINTTSKKK